MLHTFFETGRYEPPRKDGKDYVAVTNAPSMDIAKSSNFERMLYDMVNGDAVTVKGWYSELARNGYFQVDDATLQKIRTVFTSSTSTNSERLDAIRKFAKEYNHGMDPHTSSSVIPWIRSHSENNSDSHSPETPLVFLETSHVAQFTSELEQL